MRTIKQVADELGISKQRVYRYIKQNGVDVRQVESVMYLDDTAEKLVIKHFRQSATSTMHSDNAVINVLLMQLESKDRQIEELHKLLNQEQQLNAGNQARIAKLEQQKRPLLPWRKKKGDGDDAETL
jgi:predicted transcriptional regulator